MGAKVIAARTHPRARKRAHANAPERVTPAGHLSVILSPCCLAVTGEESGDGPMKPRVTT